jgi:nucleoside-diphosphate-sugar epimerase
MDKLIVGCGYLGRHVAARWLARGHTVCALTRGRDAELAALGIRPIRGDVRELLDAFELPPAETVLYSVAPGRSEEQAPKDVWIVGLIHVLAALREWPIRPRLLFTSSTSVYGQIDGEEVDETSPTHPQEEAGKVLLQAEEFLGREWPDAIVLRFAGIYGPGRLLRSQTIQGGRTIIADPDKWLNLIHVEDGANAVLAAEAHGRPGATYNISDGHPVRRRDFYTRMADVLGAPPPRFVLPCPDALPPHESTNRRIRNRRMLDELKVEFRYPNYEHGLPASAAQPK